MLPCSKCIGCRTRKALQWAVRCSLENSQHSAAAFVTLTYSEHYLPPTLIPRDLTLFIKRIRARLSRCKPTRNIRHFSCGEYGTQHTRPHYHSILFGASADDHSLIQACWPTGFTRTYNATPAAIYYVAGYAAKKINTETRMVVEQVDPTTGEVYTPKNPFLQMSRNPGIGGHARQWPNSWRTHAILNGKKIPVPRFLHEAWKAQATPEELHQLQTEQEAHFQTIQRDWNLADDAHAAAIAAHTTQQHQKRKL